MDEEILTVFSPHLLTFASIGFGVLIAIPRMRHWLKSEYDKKVAEGGIRAIDFFQYTYYMTVTQYMDAIGITYIVGALLTLLAVFFPCCKFISYVIILLATVALVTYLIAPIIPKLKRTLDFARVCPNLKEPLVIKKTEQPHSTGTNKRS